MRRISLRIVLSMLLLIVLLLGIALSLLVTQSGSRWLLNQVLGLTVQGWQGAVMTQWRAEQLQWQQDDLFVQLNHAHMQFRPSCLFRSTLCLDVLEVSRFDLTLPLAQAKDE